MKQLLGCIFVLGTAQLARAENCEARFSEIKGRVNELTPKITDYHMSVEPQKKAERAQEILRLYESLDQFLTSSYKPCKEEGDREALQAIEEWKEFIEEDRAWLKAEEAKQ